MGRLEDKVTQGQEGTAVSQPSNLGTEQKQEGQSSGWWEGRRAPLSTHGSRVQDKRN